MKQITRRFPSDRIQSPRPRVFTPDWLQRLIKYADLPSSESHQTSSDRGADIVASRRSCFHRCRQWHRHIWLHEHVWPEDRVADSHPVLVVEDRFLFQIYDALLQFSITASHPQTPMPWQTLWLQRALPNHIPPSEAGNLVPDQPQSRRDTLQRVPAPLIRGTCHAIQPFRSAAQKRDVAEPCPEDRYLLRGHVFIGWL